MWVAESCFDGETEPFRKCLLPGNDYHFGRKAPADLVLADKTVSKESAIVSIGSVKSSNEEERTPSLSVHALKRAIRIIPSGSEEEWKKDRENFIGITIDSDSAKEIQNGDMIILTKTAPGVKWLPLIFSAVNRIAKEDIEQRKAACTTLGIRLEKSKQLLTGATHLIVSSSNALTIPVMHAVATAAPLVTIGYLDEVIRRAQLDKNDEESLQKRYELPSAEHYFPEEIEVEDMTRKEVKAALAPKMSRKTLFVGTTMLFLHDERGLQKAAEQLLPICKSSGARTVDADISQYRDDETVLRLLRRNKSEAETLLAEHGEAASEAPDDGLVVICDMEDSNTIWYQRVVRLTKQLNIAMPKLGIVAISKAILYADARRFLDSIFEDDAPYEMMQDTQATTIPPTLPDERRELEKIDQTMTTANSIPTTIVPQDHPSRSTPSPPPTSHVQSAAATKSPRRPKRRADMVRRDPLEDIFGISVPSTSLMQLGSDATIPATAVGTQADQTQQPTARVRRHAAGDSKRPRISEAYRSLFGTEVTENNSQLTSTGAIATTNTFPLTRKYREELDEADRLESQRESQLQSQMDDDAGEMNEPQHRVVEEPSGRKRRAVQSPEVESQTPRQRQRREASMISEIEGVQDDNNDDMEAVEEIDSTIRPGEGRGETLRHESATEDGDGALLKEKPAKTNDDKGADTDSKFLQAMATSKKSKKPLDQFDKEFNLLRITKPNHRTGHQNRIIADVDDPEYRAWEQMTASDFDINAAGNFVQIDFVPLVYQRTEEEIREREERQKRQQHDWNGKPNYKKFKAKARPHRAPVVMDIQIGQDYGLGDTYIRPSRASRRSISMENDDGDEGVELMAPVKNDFVTRRTASGESTFLSDEEERSSVAPSTRRSTQRGPSRTQQRRSVEEEIHSVNDDEGIPRPKRRVDMRLEVDADMDDSMIRSRRQTPHNGSQNPSSTISGGKRSTINLSSDEEEVSSTFSGFRKKRRM